MRSKFNVRAETYLNVHAPVNALQLGSSFEEGNLWHGTIIACLPIDRVDGYQHGIATVHMYSAIATEVFARRSAPT